MAILRLFWIHAQRSGELSTTRLPLLYAKLNTDPITSNSSNSMASGYFLRPASSRKSLINRILSYGETKWHSLSSYPTSSIRGRIYKLGTGLIERIPLQERMLWRIYTFIGERLEDGKLSPHRNKGPPAVPPIEVAQVDLEHPEILQKDLMTLINGQMALHRRWRFYHGVAIIPALCLSLLPFVKLWLAWEIFRTVTHHRAFLAAQWLQRGTLPVHSTEQPRRRKRSVGAVEDGLLSSGMDQFIPNVLLDKSRFDEIDQELPSIIRRL